MAEGWWRNLQGKVSTLALDPCYMCYEGKVITLSASVQVKPRRTSSHLSYQAYIKADRRSRKDYWPKYLASRPLFFLFLFVWKLCSIMLWDKGRAFMQDVMVQVLWCTYCWWVRVGASIKMSLTHCKGVWERSLPVVPHLYTDWACLGLFVKDCAGTATVSEHKRPWLGLMAVI